MSDIIILFMTSKPVKMKRLIDIIHPILAGVVTAFIVACILFLFVRIFFPQTDPYPLDDHTDDALITATGIIIWAGAIIVGLMVAFRSWREKISKAGH